MADLATVIPSLIGGGGVVWFGNLALTWIKGRDGRAEARIAADAEMEKHKDGLIFDLFKATRTQMEALQLEVERLRPLAVHIYHLKESIGHIEALLSATTDDRASIERSARAFIKRMQRTADANGTLANEAQRLKSEIEMEERARNGRPV